MTVLSLHRKILRHESFLLAAGRRFYSSKLLYRIQTPALAEKVALVEHDGTKITYGQLNYASASLAVVFKDQLKSKENAGSSIGGFTKSGSTFLVSMLAAWRIGRVFVPLSSTHTSSELSYFASDSKIGLMVCSSITDIPDDFIRESTIPVAFATTESLTNAQAHNSINNGPIDTSSDNIYTDVGDTKDALIVYTSGTTGRPKGVVHSHHGLTSMIEALTSSWQYEQADKILHFLPLYHVHGILNKLLCMLWVGGEVEFMQSANAMHIWQRLAEEELLYQKYQHQQQPFTTVTLFMGVPTVYAKMLQVAASSSVASSPLPPPRLALALATLSRMRLHVSGSAALPDPVMSSWETLTGQVLLERYGMTEVGMALTNPYDAQENKPRLKGHVGLPFPRVQCRIVDVQDARDGKEAEEVVVTALDTPGELRIKGPTVFGRYLNLPDATADTFDSEGWFKTGDTAERSSEGGLGYYRILGRTSSDIIKSSGFKLSALEIERELLSHPLIQEAAVVGQADSVYGETVVAVVALRPPVCENAHTVEAMDVDSIRVFLTGKLAPYKHPRSVIIVESIPRNHMGKVNKKTLRREIQPLIQR
jgi:malonyl-CoA/methylmalonyl-CoA synthetase